MQQSLQSLCQKKTRRVIGISCELKVYSRVKVDGPGIDSTDLPG